MKKFFRTLFHLAAFPALFVGVFYVDWELIKAQYQYEGIWVMIGVLATLALALIFYTVYAIVTHAKRVNKFWQTIIVTLVASALMAASWSVFTYVLPGVIEEKTSNKVVCEDLTDKGRVTRADLNNELTDDFVEMNLHAGILPMTYGSYSEAVSYYRSFGIDDEIPLLLQYEEQSGKTLGFHTLHELFSRQFQESGYASSDIEFVNDTRLAVPCMLQITVGEDEINKSDLRNLENNLSYTVDGDKIIIREVLFAFYHAETGKITCESLVWDYVLDDREMALLLCSADDDKSSAGNYFLFKEDIFGTASVSLLKKGEKNWSGKAELLPSDNFQGVLLAVKTQGTSSEKKLTYAQMSRLVNNDYLYALASMAESGICYQYATVVFAGLFLLDGLFRIPSREERRKRKQAKKAQKAIEKEIKKQPPCTISPCTPWQQTTSFVDVAKMSQIEKTDLYRMNSQLLSDGKRKIRRGYPISRFYDKKR